MDRGAWWAAVHGVARSWTRLSNFTLFFHFHALEKEIATHSSVLAWRIPGKEEPGWLPSMGSHRVGHDWSDFSSSSRGILIYTYSCSQRQIIDGNNESAFLKVNVFLILFILLQVFRSVILFFRLIQRFFFQFIPVHIPKLEHFAWKL